MIDWNHDGKVDMQDTFIDFLIYQEMQEKENGLEDELDDDLYDEWDDNDDYCTGGISSTNEFDKSPEPLSSIDFEYIASIQKRRNRKLIALIIVTVALCIINPILGGISLILLAVISD